MLFLSGPVETADTGRSWPCRLAPLWRTVEMPRFVLVALTVATLACPATASANWLSDAWHSVCRDFRRNNCWPEPFVRSDRAAVCAPFNVMIQNGWRLENTLSEHHFERGEAELSRAGVAKIENVLTNAPPEARTIFVLRAATPELTAARIAAVQTTARRYLVAGEQAQVVETLTAPKGTQAND